MWWCASRWPGSFPRSTFRWPRASPCSNGGGKPQAGATPNSDQPAMGSYWKKRRFASFVKATMAFSTRSRSWRNSWIRLRRLGSSITAADAARRETLEDFANLVLKCCTFVLMAHLRQELLSQDGWLLRERYDFSSVKKGAAHRYRNWNDLSVVVQ